MPLMLTQEALHCLKPNCWAANAQNLPLDSIPFQYDEASCPLLLCPELAGPTHEPHWWWRTHLQALRADGQTYGGFQCSFCNGMLLWRLRCCLCAGDGGCCWGFELPHDGENKPRALQQLKVLRLTGQAIAGKGLQSMYASMVVKGCQTWGHWR